MSLCLLCLEAECAGACNGSRGPKRLRLSEFVQISEFFSNYITDICQTSESFAKSVNLKKERAERTIPSVEATGILR